MQGRYKLVIVDDEHIIREGLANAVDWQSLDVRVVAECKNGEEAYRAVRQFEPDIILSDVRMPVMDGLELAEKLAADNFDGAVLFYSGYSDFEYVRAALDYGVSGYVLKPAENEELLNKVREAIVALEKRRKNRAAFESLASGLTSIKEMYFRKLEEGTDDESLRNQLAVLNVAVPPSGSVLYGKALRVGAAFEKLYSALEEALEKFESTGFFRQDKFIMITRLADRDALCDCAERLLAALRGEEKGAFASVGISDAFGGGQKLCDAVAQAKKAASPVQDTGGVFTDGAIDAGTAKPNKLIRDAIAYIAEHYSEKLSVKRAASELFVSESHLMHEFKTETGWTFNAYLKYYRVNQAKALIVQGKMSVAEIAAAVGIPDKRYFIVAFREYTGKTPEEYSDLIHAEE